LHHWRSTKFSAPYNQGVIQQAALVEIFDQCSNRAVCLLTLDR
jgi:hypothetical protein